MLVEVAEIGPTYSQNHLSADEVAARTKAVVANIDPSTATDIPDAVDVPKRRRT